MMRPSNDKCNGAKCCFFIDFLRTVSFATGHCKVISFPLHEQSSTVLAVHGMCDNNHFLSSLISHEFSPTCLQIAQRPDK